MKNAGGKMLSGAVILGAGTFIAKLLGAAYRIPLTKLIGGTGLGIYQTVFPVYALLLDFSGAGVPNAMAKLIASHGEKERDVYAKRLLGVSLAFFALLGAALSVALAAFSGTISKAQGNAGADIAYVYLAPSVFLVCIVCCFRGYFQGYMNMTPTALSQIVEQVVKLAAGLLLARAFLPDIRKAVAGATLGITLSELVALIFVFVFYRVKKPESLLRRDKSELNAKANGYGGFFKSLKDLLRYAAPVSLAVMILPLSKVADSFIIVNMLSEYRSDATALYGLFSGVALTVAGLPVAVCYGVSAVAVPFLSRAKENDKNKAALKTLIITLAFSVPCAAFCYFAAPFIMDILFDLPVGEKTVAVNLLRLVSPCVVLLSVLQTLNGVLIGKGRPFAPLLGLFAGVAVKIAIEIFTLNSPETGIYGAAIAAIACYFVSDLLNLTMVFVKIPKTAVRVNNADLKIKGGEYVNR